MVAGPNQPRTSAPPSGIQHADGIEAWLAVFSRMLHVPENRKQAICAELYEHLRERVRDLMLTGRSEAQSIQLAIEELGETANLAQRFESANRTKHRRWLMHMSIIAITAGAVTVGFVATQPRSRLASVFEERQAENTEISKDARLTIEADSTLGSILQSIPRQTTLGLSIDWGELEPLGYTKDAPWGLAGNLPVQRVLELISEHTSSDGVRMDWRFDGHTVVINTARYFDAKESVLACYDIHDTVEMIVGTTNVAGEQAVEQVHEVIHNLVEPDNWRDNGGDLAAMHIVGQRMFVQAPPRMHKRIEWILQQLADGERQKKMSQSSSSDPIESPDLFEMRSQVRRLEMELSRVAAERHPNDPLVSRMAQSLAEARSELELKQRESDDRTRKVRQSEQGS